MAATVDKTTDNRLRDLVMDNFGLTPFLNTYPDFLAGGAVMITALFIAAGMEESKTLRSWLNTCTVGALTFVMIIGIWRANPDTLRDQPFLLDGSKGVMISASVVYLVFGGIIRIGVGAKSSTQPCRLIPLANGLSQLSMTLSLFAIAIILPMNAKLSPLGLVPEVPLLQALEDESGSGWARFVVAGTAVVCLNLSLLELSLPLHALVQDLVREGLLFRFLSSPFSKTDTPFFGCVLIGSVTAVVSTLGDVTRLLLIAATSRVLLDLLICLACLAVRFGVGGSRGMTGNGSQKSSIEKGKQTKKRSRQTRNMKSRLPTISRNVSSHHETSPNAASSNNPSTSLHHAEDVGHHSRPGVSPANGSRRIDAADCPSSAWPSRFLNFCQSNVPFWKVRFRNYENVVDNNTSLYWGEPEGLINDDHSVIIRRRDGNSLSNAAGITATEESGYFQNDDHAEAESSPSGYETETSVTSTDDSDDDDVSNVNDGDNGGNETDIDVVIDEFRSSTSMTTISLSSSAMPEHRDQSEINLCRRRSSSRPRPTQQTSNCVILATVLLLFAFGTQYFIIESMQKTTLTAAVIMNLGLSVTVFALILLISKQPQDRPNGIENTFLVPLTPWTQILAIFLNLSLASHIVPETYPEMLSWIVLGLIVYFGYGLRQNRGETEGIKRRRASHLVTQLRRPSHLNLTPIIPETEMR